MQIGAAQDDDLVPDAGVLLVLVVEEDGDELELEEPVVLSLLDPDELPELPEVDEPEELELLLPLELPFRA